MARITLRVQHRPAALDLALDDERLELEGEQADAYVSPGYHVLSIRAADAPGTAFSVAITDPPEASWTADFVVGDDGEVAARHGFHVDGGPRGGGPGLHPRGRWGKDDDGSAMRRDDDEDDWPGPMADA